MRVRNFGIIMIACLAAFFALEATSSASTFTVNKTADTDDGICNADCSLREAITTAEGAPGADTIAFSISNGVGTITLGGNLPPITESLLINGPVSGKITIDANGTGRAFIINSTSDDQTLTLAHMTITRGNAGSGDGGGVLVETGDTLRALFITFSGNSAANGGVVWNNGGTVEVEDSVFTNNTAATNGGAIATFGPNTGYVRRSEFSSNTAAFGSALYQSGSAAFTVENCTISGNDGSAVFNVSAAGTTVIVNNSTISGTTGNGIFSSVADTEVYSTIISASTGLNCVTAGGGTVTSAGYNIEDALDCGFLSTGDHESTNPAIASLAYNGGWSRTYALLANSPAIDAGDFNCFDTSTDQRGLSRQRDGDSNGIAVCDIGAYEVKNPDIMLTPVSLSFVVNSVGSSASKSLILENQTTAAVTLSTISDGGPFKNDFVISDNCPGLLQFGESCTISVTFTATCPTCTERAYVFVVENGKTIAQVPLEGLLGSVPPPSEGGTSSSKSGCFIATAAYGSPMAKEVDTLRRFRDRHLMTNAAGRGFVRLYYRYSPPLANVIARHDGLRALARAALTPVVFSVKHPGTAMAGFIFVLGAVGVLAYRRRERAS